MTPAREVRFEVLPEADLVVDAVYRGGTTGTAGDDPIARLLPVGNQGGFRFHGRRALPGCRLIALFSTFAEPDWPDHLDSETGRFTYFGDNRRPGHELHDTARGGNTLLRLCFDAVHATPSRRDVVPPFLVFSRVGDARDVQFRGLAVPGAPAGAAVDDLVAIWKTAGDQRFQNYRAVFTLLDVAVVPRAWLRDVAAGRSASVTAPDAWHHWIATGNRRALQAPRTRLYRSRSDQMPTGPEDAAIVRAVYEYFRGAPVEFEACAVELARLLSPNIVDCDLTRPWRDGGRDAVGRYRIGPANDPIWVEFALEAKCYAPDHSVGIEQTSRLISRLRFRQFGILVTTSWVHPQAYQEIRDDGHPVVIVCGRDLAELLRTKGLGTAAEVHQWLASRFPGLGRGEHTRA